MPLDCAPKQTHHPRPVASSSATQGTGSTPSCTPSSSTDSRSGCDFRCDWHRVTDCSFHRWSTGASDSERRCVAKFLGRVTAGKEIFKRQMKGAMEQPPKDPTARPGDVVRQVYENTEAAGGTVRGPWRSDYVIHPKMASEKIIIRPRLLNWPIPPSLALH